MKKLILFSASLFILTKASFAQIDANQETTAIGLGATSTAWWLKYTYQNNSIPYYGLGWFTDNAFVNPMAYLTGYGGIKLFSGGEPTMTLTNPGNVGVGTIAPVSLFQVDDGASKFSVGNAGGSQALNWGTSYIGFNASRVGTNWLTNSDAAPSATGNNGGGVIYSSVFGDMYFVAVPNTGGSSGQTLTDATLASKIAMRIDHADGAVYMKQAYVQTSGWPDFVFKKGYSLRPLSEVKSYIEQNQHLPDMPAASTVEKDGINLGEMNKALLKKVEELTLYLIEKDKELMDQRNMSCEQNSIINQLKTRVDKLEKTVKSTN